MIFATGGVGARISFVHRGRQNQPKKWKIVAAFKKPTNAAMWTPGQNLFACVSCHIGLSCSDITTFAFVWNYFSEYSVMVTNVNGHQTSKNMVKFAILWNVPSTVRAVWQDRLVGWAFELPGAFSQLAAAGQRLLLAVALFASTSTTVAAEGRGVLTPTHIFRVGLRDSNLWPSLSHLPPFCVHL